MYLIFCLLLLILFIIKFNIYGITLLSKIKSNFYVFKPNEIFEIIAWPLNLPLSCSDNMNAITKLYLNSMSINASIFLAVFWLMVEALNTSISKKVKIDDWSWLEWSYKSTKKKLSYFYNYPWHFQTWEEHLIDIFAIVVPTLIVLNQIVPTLGYLYNEEYLFYEKIISFQLNVIGNQWFWTYEYVVDLKIDDDSFSYWVDNYNKEDPLDLYFTYNSVIVLDNPENRLLDVDKSVVLPINTNVLLSFTSRDVIHAWALPQMGIKVDTVPGRITSTIFNSYSLGVFYGQCSELCGPLHGFMPICVEVILPDYFVIWALLEAKTYSTDFSFSYYNVVEKLLHLSNEE